MKRADIYREGSREYLPLGTHLAPGEDVPLVLRARGGDRAALTRLCLAHFGLVVQIAARYARTSGQPTEDLVQEGCLGVLRAVARFDVDRGLRFTTYATYWIRAYVLEFIIDNKGPVRTFTTVAQRKIFFGLAKARAAIEHSGRPVTETALAKRLGVSLEDVRAVVPRVNEHDVALDEPFSDSGEQRGALMASETETPEMAAMATDSAEARRTAIRAAIGRLPVRDRRVVALRYLGEEPKTLVEVGRVLGCSRQRVQQIEARAMKQLGKMLAAKSESW